MASLDYDALSPGYDELYGQEQMEKYRECFRLLRITCLGKVLDAGCGTALLLEYLHSNNIPYEAYIGIDKSAGMLRQALPKLRGEAHLIQADIHHLPIRDKTLDQAFMFTVIHHLEAERALGELVRAVRGPIVVSRHRRLGCRLPRVSKLVGMLSSDDLHLL
ncbi:MAG: class I SAM-dependent methyltransferase [Aigarchaeota archaeon]|nr:class I SAM-dependent methyltransferase [Candidatus Pelearchaeum maunauluense]